jgi:phage baseplate assembly protein W
MNDAFLGRGWEFPPTFDSITKTAVMTEYEADVASSLTVLLTTMRGERVMLPLYGCNMQELLFRSLDTRMKTLMIDMIETAIIYHEPRIKLENVTLNDDSEIEGRVLIEVTYRIKTTNSRFNFVFPFYKNEGTDVNLTSSVRLLSDNT